MRDRIKSPWLILLPTALAVGAGSALAGQSLHKGFFWYDTTGMPLQLESAELGLMCTEVSGQDALCGNDRNITVTGMESCQGNDGNRYPCTRYGYRFDYSGAAPGDTIECKSTRRDPFNSRSMEYRLTLEESDGTVFHPSWIPWNPVKRRAMLTEVHECTYRGQPLATIEYLVSYEPGAGFESGSGPSAANAAPPGANEAASPGTDSNFPDDDGPGSGGSNVGMVPDACDDLTEEKARRLMGVDSVQEGFANEHIPDLWSQCTWTSIGAPIREVGYVYKLMLKELYDTEKLNPMQLTFHATFASGGQPPSSVIEGMGSISFEFEKGNSSTLMVVTGSNGPPEGSGRPRVLVLFYYLDDPTTPHIGRFADLRVQAELKLKELEEPQSVP